MDQIKKFNKMIDDIEKTTDIEEKSQSIKIIKDLIKEEQLKVDELIKKVDGMKSKKYKKFKGMNLEQLTKKFDEENLDEKVKIFQNISYLIGKTKDRLFIDD